MWEREPKGTSTQLRLLTSKRAAASRSAAGACQHALACGERLLNVRALGRDVECALEGAARGREVIGILLGDAQIVIAVPGLEMGGACRHERADSQAPILAS